MPCLSALKGRCIIPPCPAWTPCAGGTAQLGRKKPLPQVEISKRLVLINSASSVATRVLQLTVLVWVQQHLIKRISAEEYSLLPIVYSVMAFTPLLTLVCTHGIGRFAVEAYAQGDTKRVAAITSTMFPILIAVSLALLVVGVLLVVFMPYLIIIPEELLWDARVMLGMLLATSAATLMWVPFSMGFYVRQRLLLGDVLKVGSEVFRMAMLLGLLLLVSTRVLWVVLAASIAQAAVVIVRVIVSRRILPEQQWVPSLFSWKIAREIIGFGGWAFVARVGETIRNSADPLILNHLGTAHDVLCFNLGRLPQSHIQGFVGTLNTPLGPALTAMHARGDMAGLQRNYMRTVRYGLWAATPMCLPLIIFSSEVIDLYVGPQFHQAAFVLAFITASVMAESSARMITVMANATARVRPWALGVLGMNLFNLGLTFYFVGSLHMGARGSALATFCALTAGYMLVFWPLGCHIMQLSFRHWATQALLPGLLPTAVSGAVWVAIKYTLAPHSWVGLALAVIAGGCAFIATIFFAAMREDDRVLLEWARGGMAKFLSSLRGRNGRSSS